jgi:Di-haem oxidoreductase, putative peroxidase
VTPITSCAAAALVPSPFQGTEVERVVSKVLGRLLGLAGAAIALYLVVVVVNVALGADSGSSVRPARSAPTRLLAHGRHIFRDDTFGDQAFWGGALRLNQAIAGRTNGGVGPGVSPKTALSVGLKVDSQRLPRAVKDAIKSGKVDLNDPKVTLALLKLNAVVGVRGFFRGKRLSSMGITCALCHSTVDGSFAPGIGHRLDGWPNRDLNVGAIVSLAPNKKPITDLLGVDEATVNKVLAAWGPGKFDAELFLDGKGFRPDGKSAATLIPAAFGLAGVNLHTYTGWGSIPYWNAFVANLEMHGIGNFDDARLANANQFPVAARAGFAHVRHKRDLITSKLPALQLYQLSLPVPHARHIDRAAAKRGKRIFNGVGRCANCHMPPTFTDSGWNLHRGREICTDDFQADRSPTFRYRTTPLRGMVAKTKGGFYHDGRFPTLRAVVDHYDGCFGLRLSPRQKSDLVEYLRGL